MLYRFIRILLVTSTAFSYAYANESNATVANVTEKIYSGENWQSGLNLTDTSSESSTLQDMSARIESIQAYQDIIDSIFAPLSENHHRGCVGNLVWFDANRDGYKQSDEIGVAGAVVDLIDLEDTIVATETSGNGYFNLCAKPGNYKLRLRALDGFTVTKRNEGTDDYHDSDSNAEGYIDVQVLADKNVGKYDFGLVRITHSSGANVKSVNSENISVEKLVAVEKNLALSEANSFGDRQVEAISDISLNLQTTDISLESKCREDCEKNMIWIHDGNGERVRAGSDKGKSEVSLSSQNSDLFDSDLLESNLFNSRGYFKLCGPPGLYSVVEDVPVRYKSVFMLVDENKVNYSYTNSEKIEEDETEAGRRVKNNHVSQIPKNIENTKPDALDNLDELANAKEKPIVDSETQIDSETLVGVWVESRHRNDGVFGRFNSALVWVTIYNIEKILTDARNTNTKLIIQLGSAAEWGWNFKNNTSSFTLEKWKNSINRFSSDNRLRALIKEAINDKIIISVYLIDEPHHVRWSPNRDNNIHISNRDIDEMAGYIKKFWPNASTSVRASPRTLMSYDRERIDWEHLDDAFLMINYRKWSKNGIRRTIEGFLERELEEAHSQGLGVIGSVQMLIGAPESSIRWWPDGMRPVGKLKTSPVELETYVEAFLAPRNRHGIRNLSGERLVDTVMIFRWDRNDERDWDDKNYRTVIEKLINKFK